MLSARLDPRKVSIALGLFAAVMHVIWSVIVALGLGQAWMNWVFGLHFISHSFVVQPFNFVTSIMLIVAAFVVAAIFGWIFATVWNWVVNRK